jgi:ABC-type uncharacterized transport system ATPase subunit
VSVIYISLSLGEIEQIADRAVALRDGRNAGELGKGEIKHEKTKNSTDCVMAFTLALITAPIRCGTFCRRFRWA